MEQFTTHVERQIHFLTEGVIWPLFQYICEGNLSVRPLPPNSRLFIVMKSSVLLSNIVVEKGVLVFVSKIACQRIFVLSDLDVPRTYLVAIVAREHLQS